MCQKKSCGDLPGTSIDLTAVETYAGAWHTSFNHSMVFKRQSLPWATLSIFLMTAVAAPSA